MEQIDVQLRQIIVELLAEQGRELNGELTGETRLRRDLGMDSLELAILTAKLEAATGIDVFADGVVGSVGQVQQRLNGRW